MPGEPVALGVVVERVVLAHREQRQRRARQPARRRRSSRARSPQAVTQVDARARDQLGDRVAVHAHDLGDLVVRELLELAQGERLALARGQALVGGADLLLVRRQQRLAPAGRDPRRPPTGTAESGISAAAPRGAGRSRRSSRGARPSADRSRSSGRGRQARQPLENLRNVSCVASAASSARAGDPVAEVVGAALVAVVERREGGAVPAAARRASASRSSCGPEAHRSGGPSGRLGDEEGGPFASDNAEPVRNYAREAPGRSSSLAAAP